MRELPNALVGGERMTIRVSWFDVVPRPAGRVGPAAENVDA